MDVRYYDYDGNHCDGYASKGVKEQSRHQCHKSEVILSFGWVDSHSLLCQRLSEEHFHEEAVHF